jgi:putative flippase GtrA
MTEIASQGHVRLHATQGMKFITCGLIGATIEFSILKLLIGHYGISPFIVYIPSALIPAVFVFFFNKYITFRSIGRTASQTKRFLMVYVVAFCANYALSSFLYSVGSILFLGDEYLGVILTDARVAYLAKALAIGVTAVFNYALSHMFIFRSESDLVLESDMAIY